MLRHAVERCEGEMRRWSTAEKRPFRPVSADKNLRAGRTEKEEERKLRQAEAIAAVEKWGGGIGERKDCLEINACKKKRSNATVAGSKT